ncbi:PepSY-like domain-containing protein [Flavobacterium sp.]|uniref:PepSY-like domain-containing protein n=1 Tax=Flavobacterium sp. TaxID=239 RepID=UPI003265A66D
MKKLILSAAIVLGSLSVNATAIPIIDLMSQSLIIVQDEFSEIKSDAIPDAVKSTIEKSFPNTKLEKVYVNDKKEYKIEISRGDNKYTVFTDASGNIIKK